MSKKLANLLNRSKCYVVLDDEKNFTFDGSNMEGNNKYYTNDKSNCPDSVRFVGKEKFPPKVMVWGAICKCGISKSLIRRSKSEAVNSDIKSKMKKFDINIVESLLAGVKAKVKSIDDNGIYFSFKKFRNK